MHQRHVSYFFLETEPQERVPRNYYIYLNIRSIFPKIVSQKKSGGGGGLNHT